MKDHLLAESRLSRRQVLAAAAAAAASVAFYGAEPGSARAAVSIARRKGGDLRIVASELFPQDVMDPVKMINIGENVAGGHVFEGLTRVDPTFRIFPVLAESWSHNSAFTQWKFRLRGGVTFHDGRPLTAADVAWSLKRNLDPKIGSSQYARLSATLTPEGVVATDKRTLTLTMSHPDSNILYPLAGYETWILPEGTTEFDKAIGTGPFKQDSFVAGDHWQLSRNEHYWQPGLPYLDSISIRHIAEPSTRVEAVLAGQADITKTEPSLLKLSNGQHSANLIQAKSTELYNVAMDSTVAPFNDNRVRLAMKLALDRTRLIKVAYGGYGVQTADTVVSSGDKTYFPSALQAQLKQNLAKSNALLAAAGHSGGLDVQLQTDTEPGLQTFGLAFADALSASKFRVKVDVHPSATYWDQQWMKAPLFVSDWYARHPLEALSTQFASKSTQNEPKFRSAKLDQLLVKSFSSDGSAQRRYIQQALTLVAHNSGDVIPAYLDFLWLTSKSVSGLSARPDVQMYAGAAMKS